MKKKGRHTSHSQAETKKIASNLLREMGAKGVMCLYGTLGAGKTTFVKGLAEALGIPEMSIKSPTYTYLREYITPEKTVFHFDLYRLEGKSEVARHMILEAQERKPDLMLIEWAENLEKHLPEKRVDIRFEVKGDTERDIQIEHT